MWAKRTFAFCWLHFDVSNITYKQRTQFREHLLVDIQRYVRLYIIGSTANGKPAKTFIYTCIMHLFCISCASNCMLQIILFVFFSLIQFIAFCAVHSKNHLYRDATVITNMNTVQKYYKLLMFHMSKQQIYSKVEIWFYHI